MKYHRVVFPESCYFSRFVEEIYCLSNSGKQTGQETCAVNGNIGISFSLNGYTQIKDGNQWTRAPRVFTFGMSEKPRYFKKSQNYREITISFRGHQLRHFVRESMTHLGKGKIVDAHDLFPSDQVDRLCDAFRSTDDDQKIYSLVNDFLKSCFQPLKHSNRLNVADRMISSGKASSVQGLAQQLDVSSATLRNNFRDHVGLSPKSLIRISRVNRVLRHRPLKKTNFTQLAHQMGYFDQAHFVNEFRNVMGVSPKKYFRNEDLVFDFYNYGRWISNKLHA